MNLHLLYLRYRSFSPLMSTADTLTATHGAVSSVLLACLPFEMFGQLEPSQAKITVVAFRHSGINIWAIRSCYKTCWNDFNLFKKNLNASGLHQDGVTKQSYGDTCLIWWRSFLGFRPMRMRQSRDLTWSFGLCPGRAPASCFGWWWGAGVRPKSERLSLFELLQSEQKRERERDNSENSSMQK